MEITRSPALAGRCHLAVDGTGVGRPVVHLLRRARPEGIPLPALITCADTESQGKGFYRIPNRDLITLACWAARKVYPGGQEGEERWWRSAEWRRAERSLGRR